MSFAPNNYSKNKTSQIVSDGDLEQRAEMTYALDSGWSIEKFDADKTSVIAKNGDSEQRAVVVYNLGNSGGGGGGGSASEITYHNPNYPTVEAALDKLLYVAPVINSFTGGGTYEVGTSISTVNLAWTINKTITSQSLNQGIGSLNSSLRSYTYTPTSAIKTNTTFTLTISDGTTTKTANTSISFGKYRYWGVSAKDTLEDSDIRGLANKGWYSSIALSKTSFDCSPTEQEPDGFYIYYAVPTEVTTDPTFKLNGLPNTAYVKTVKKDYVNSLGTTITYTIYRFMKDNKLTDKYELEVA